MVPAKRPAASKPPTAIRGGRGRRGRVVAATATANGSGHQKAAAAAEKVAVAEDTQGGRRGSSRVEILKKKEAERRQKEEEEKLRMLKDLQEKRIDREKRRLEKMRALGADFVMAERKRKLKKKLRKRKRELKGSDDDNDGDYKNEKKEKLTKRKEKKRKKGDNMYREFFKFSSGSEASGGEESDLEELYHEIEVRLNRKLTWTLPFFSRFRINREQPVWKRGSAKSLKLVG